MDMWITFSRQQNEMKRAGKKTIKKEIVEGNKSCS